VHIVPTFDLPATGTISVLASLVIGGATLVEDGADVTNMYGIYISDVTASAVPDNMWAIYSAGTDPSYFAGEVHCNSLVGIGTSSPNQELEINTSANPTLRIAENSTTSYLELIEVAAGQARINKTNNSGTSSIDINPLVTDGTSAAQVRIFRSTNTTGAATFQVLKGNDTTTVNHSLRGDGTSYLCADSGNLGIGTTSPNKLLELYGATSPTLRIAEASTTSYFELTDLSITYALIEKTSLTGVASIDISPKPVDGTSNANVRAFRYTDTTGAVSLQVLLGDDTATINAQISGSGNSYLCSNNGVMAIGSSTVSTSQMLRVFNRTTSQVAISIRGLASTTVSLQNWLYDGTIRAELTQTASASYLRLQGFDNGASYGPYVRIDKNDNVTTPSAGVIGLENKDGDVFWLYVDANDVVRAWKNATPPISTDDTSGGSLGTATV
jgi:hypothetical protein